MDLLAGALVVAAASFLGGVTGFGYSLVATPLLLLLGFPLPFVVTANLALACVTRVSVAYRFRSDARPARAAGLIGGSVPGLWLGAVVLTSVDDATIKLGAGVVVMAAAVLLWRAVTAPPPRELPGAPVAAGFAGGFLGAATSLNGVAPVLLLARDKAEPRSVLADLALYFVASNAIGLAILLTQGALDGEALFPAFMLWLPGSLAGNWAGTVVGPRLPEAGFRRLTLAVVFAAGAVTALTA
jgi:uncharacterized membrane protein YfcA